jgi:hypothetical protein
VKYKLLILTLLSIVFCTQVMGVEGRPRMRRACLSKADSVLDLQWFRPTDNCGSFTYFHLYGRDNALGTFDLLGRWTDYSLTNLSIKLKNNKNWEFYIIYQTACNGIDSIYSDTIMIDNSVPNTTELDSISVDLVSQQLILGWQYSSTPDTKGYIGLYVNEKTNKNSSVFDTFESVYFHPDSGNPSTASVSYGLATYDTCNNLSPISAIHKTMFLQSVYDKCSKTIRLNWSPYIGWASQEHEIFLSVNNGNFQKIGTVVSQINQFTYNFNAFGDIYCFYIRAIKQGSSISSSSNKVCITTDGVIATTNSYIAKASVQNNAVELTMVTSIGSSLERLHIYKGMNNGTMNLFSTQTFTGGTLEIIDTDVKVQSNTYQYQFTTEGPCDLIFDTSQIAGTILLKAVMLNPGNQNLNWNEYSEFIKGSENQEVLLGNSANLNKSSTWNILSTENNGINNYNDNSNFSSTQEQLCYCIRAIENNANVSYNRKDTSYSNIQCVTAEPLVFFPNAIQINGFNTVFKPVGTFIDTTQSSFQIYNRWGEIIFESKDIKTGWDGRNSSGEFVQSDVYAYKARIIGINGKILYFDGTITVLK